MMKNKYGYFKYLDFVVGAKEEASYTTNAELQEGSSIEQLSHGVSPWQYASFEQDTYNTNKPNNFYKQGELGLLTKQVSLADGSLQQPVVIEVKLFSVFKLMGITIHSGNIIRDVEMRMYNSTIGDNGITKNFSATSKDYFYSFDDGVVADTITITIKKIDQPKHFVSIYGIDFGRTRIIDGDKILNVNMTTNYSILSEKLEYNTLDMTIANPKDENYLFQRRQPLQYINNGEIERTFYVETGVEQQNGNINVTAYDSISFLEGDFFGGVYDRVLLDDIVAKIFENTGIEYELYNASDFKITGYIPITTRRKALQMVLAACPPMSCEREKDKLIFSILETEISSKRYNEDNILNDIQIDKRQPIKKFILTVHHYAKKTETMEAYHWYISRYNQSTIKFSQPLHDLKAYEVIGKDEEGNDIIATAESKNVKFIERGENYCIVEGDTPNKVVIVGGVYSDSTESIELFDGSIPINLDYVEYKVETTLYSNPNSMIDEIAFRKQQRDTVRFRTFDKPIISDRYNILNSLKNITKITDQLNGIYEVEAE